MKISDFPDITSEDTYSTALMLLFMFKDDPAYSTLSELVYILEHKSFINFLKYYEGQTITVPSLHDTVWSLRALLVYQYFYVDSMPWEEALQKAGFEHSDSGKVKRMMRKFYEAMEKYKIGRADERNT